MTRKTTIIALGAGAVLAAAGAFGAISMTSAQTPSQTPGATATKRQQVRDDFVNHLATNLNVTADQLTSATKSAELQTVDDLLADGTLTAGQGAKLKERINSSQGLVLGRFLGARAKQQMERLERIRRGIVESSAQAIGIDAATLRDALKGGSSIADVAAQHSVSLDTVKAQISGDAKTKLDAAVQKGTITQAREDALLQTLSGKLGQILNKKKS